MDDKKKAILMVAGLSVIGAISFFATGRVVEMFHRAATDRTQEAIKELESIPKDISPLNENQELNVNFWNIIINQDD